MVSKQTPSYKYKWKTPPKDKAKSYELRLAAQFGDSRAKSKLAAYNRRIKERKMEASKTEWVVEGRSFNRYRMMDFIVTRTANGELLTQMCDNENMPSALEVYSWFETHPEFEAAFKRAEKVRGHLLGDEVETIARNTDRENVQADKLKTEVLSKAAARLNSRFQDRQVVETKDEFANMTEDQIRDRVRRMLVANPELQSLVPAGILGHQAEQETLELHPEPESPNPDLALDEAPEQDES